MSAPALEPGEANEPGAYFKPNSWAQHRCLVSRTPQLLYSGRYGSSKTRTLCEKGDLYCRLYPGARAVIARRWRTDLGQTTLQVLLEETISPDERAWGWRPAADGGSTLFYRNGSRILCVGLDNPGKLRSGQFGLGLVDQAEELEEQHWNAILGRLRHRVGDFRQLAGFCNPGGPTHFLYKLFRPDRGSHLQRTTEPTRLLNGTVMPAGLPLRECVLAAALDNLGNLPEDYQLVLQHYTGVYRERYVLGKWVAFEGSVYSSYDPDVHLAGRGARVPLPTEWDKWAGLPPPDWERVVGIDLGFENPFACEWFAISPEGHWWRYRELYKSGETVDRHAVRIRAEEDAELQQLRARALVNAAREGTLKDTENLWGGKGATPWDGWLEELHVTGRYCDHDRGERELLARAGVWTRPANKEIEPGIQTVMRALAERRLHLVVDAGVERDVLLAARRLPTSLEEEFPGYQWSKRRSGELADAPRDLPVDRDNHALDALRYAIHSHATLPRAAVY